MVQILMIRSLGLVLVAAIGIIIAQTTPLTVPTYECISIYWNPSTASASTECKVKYRKQGSSDWKNAQSLWYSKVYETQYRGSIVNLDPATTYEIELQAGSQTTTITQKTRSDNVPIARVVKMKSGTDTLTITEGGTENGWVLYDGSEATIDVKDKYSEAVKHVVWVKAPYVIVKGLKVRGGRIHGIMVRDVSDVIIEDCDVTDWSWRGGYTDAGIFVHRTSLRVVVQGNKIYKPHKGSNTWKTGHPTGPNAIHISRMVDTSPKEGNHIVRFNECWSSTEQQFNDGIGGQGNTDLTGFPGTDSDIYGNIMRHVADDAFEIEGGGRNVRIWGNYTDQIAMGHVATAAVTVGPLYVFRNVFNRGQHNEFEDDPVYYAKVGYGSPGIQYWYHNSCLQDGSNSLTIPRVAIQGVDGGAENLVTRNNIFMGRNSILAGEKGSNSFDYDLTNKGFKGSHAVTGIPTWASGSGPETDGVPKGKYQLATNSKGYNSGVVLPNFNDNYEGNAPDIGAQEHAGSDMLFGVKAWDAYKARFTVSRGGTSNIDRYSSNGYKSLSKGISSPMIVNGIKANSTAKYFTISGKQVTKSSLNGMEHRKHHGVFVVIP